MLLQIEECGSFVTKMNRNTYSTYNNHNSVSATYEACINEALNIIGITIFLLEAILFSSAGDVMLTICEGLKKIKIN